MIYRLTIYKYPEQNIINEEWEIASSKIGKSRNNGLRQRIGLFFRLDLKVFLIFESIWAVLQTPWRVWEGLP